MNYRMSVMRSLFKVLSVLKYILINITLYMAPYKLHDAA